MFSEFTSKWLFNIEENRRAVSTGEAAAVVLSLSPRGYRLYRYRVRRKECQSIGKRNEDKDSMMIRSDPDIVFLLGRMVTRISKEQKKIQYSINLGKYGRFEAKENENCQAVELPESTFE